MAHKNAPKVTPETAKLKYEAMITEKAQEFAPMVRDAFPTKSALLIALDNSVRFLETSMVALGTQVTADYFCMHGPLTQYPDQLFTLMMLFVATGTFASTDPEVSVFSLENAPKWVFTGNVQNKEQAE